MPIAAPWILINGVRPMDLLVGKKEFLRLASRMQGVAERKSTMPVLSNVLLTVDGPNELKLSATDLYLSMSGKVTAEIKKGGSVAVPAKDLLPRENDAGGVDPDHLARQLDHRAQGRWERASLHAQRHSWRGLSAASSPRRGLTHAGHGRRGVE